MPVIEINYSRYLSDSMIGYLAMTEKEVITYSKRMAYNIKHKSATCLLTLIAIA
jgi:PP-loop superfamily ATP-utilizing enzyme